MSGQRVNSDNNSSSISNPEPIVNQEGINEEEDELKENSLPTMIQTIVMNNPSMVENISNALSTASQMLSMYASNMNHNANQNNINEEHQPGSNDEFEERKEQNTGEEQFTDIVSDAMNNNTLVKHWLFPYLSIFTIGGSLGFVSGLVMKRAGGNVLKASILPLVIIQLLSYKGYVTVDWDHIKYDINELAKSQQNTNALQFIIANIGPILGGFVLGFHLG